jgi:hypothetical protein
MSREMTDILYSFLKKSRSLCCSLRVPLVREAKVGAISEESRVGGTTCVMDSIAVGLSAMVVATAGAGVLVWPMNARGTTMDETTAAGGTTRTTAPGTATGLLV